MPLEESQPTLVSETGGCNDRCSVSCGLDLFWGYETFADRNVQEAGFKDPEQSGICFRVKAKVLAHQAKYEVINRFWFNGFGLLPLAFRLFDLHGHGLDVWREILRCPIPHAIHEIIECGSTGNIKRVKSGNDCVDGCCAHHIHPDSKTGDMEKNHEKHRAKHRGRLPWRRSAQRILGLHNPVDVSQVEIEEHLVDPIQTVRAGCDVDLCIPKLLFDETSVIMERDDCGFHKSASNLMIDCAATHIFIKLVAEGDRKFWRSCQVPFGVFVILLTFDRG